MKKLFVFALILLLSCGQVVFADVQIDEGQKLGTAAVKFFVARNARPTAGISKDYVVVWDSTSKDGVTVTTTTTSGDKLVAGIALDDFRGVTSDAAATSNSSFNNWGRVQTWGLHNNAKYVTGAVVAAGGALCASATAGSLVDCDIVTSPVDGDKISADLTGVGVALEADSSNTVDMMVKVD